jgi:Tol biopolymer transport system component
MAEYLSLGPEYPRASTVIRDAALNGNLPTIQQMTERPEEFDPYRFGQPLWAWIGQRYGDEVIGSILAAVPNVGIERAFKRETGKSLEDLGEEWKEAMQVRYLPQVAQLERPRAFAQPVLSERRSGGQIFLAPSLSPDGKYIAFLSNGSFLRGQVFIDLWLADARTGKRLARLVKSTFDPNYQELQLIYSQSSFSPDGKRLAFTALAGGKEVLYLFDVKHRKRVATIKLQLDGLTNPSWSPDGRHLVFSGNKGGITDLYMVDADGRNFRQLTNDKHGDFQPQWSPDGSTIAWATDRGEGSDVATLHFPHWRIALYHVDNGRVELLPNQSGLNINPQWSPDSRSIIFVSDRTGGENLFLYDLPTREQYQLTKVIGGILAITEYSPAITWAHGADQLAFTYYENGQFTVWSVDNPRLLKRAPYRESQSPQLAAVARPHPDSSVADTSTSDSARTSGGTSFYRSSTGVIRPSADLPDAAERAGASGPMTVAAVLDSAAVTLPDTSRFKQYKYHIRFSPDFVARPTIGYARDNFGNGVFGGTAIVLSDMVGNNRLAFAGAINGRLSEAQVFAGYTNLAHRLQYTTGIYQEPYYFGQTYNLAQEPASGNYIETQIITRYIERQAFGVAIYPFNRFTRSEFGLRLTSLGRSDLIFQREIDPTFTFATQFSEHTLSSTNLYYVQPYLAYVSDNVLWGLTSPIYGRRYRFQVTPTAGNLQWLEYLADYRRYDPILFNYLTVATRFTASISSGRDADTLRKYLGYADVLRGYERRTFLATEQNCPLYSDVLVAYRCSPLLGSRVAFASAELRFPLLRGGGLGGVIPVPPIEGAIFYDAGTAWFSGQTLKLRRQDITDPANERSLLTSHGFGLRVNLFNYVILRWDYAVPHEAPGGNRGFFKGGFWRFSLYPPF